MQGQSYLHKSIDLAFFTLTLLSRRISVRIIPPLPFTSASIDSGGPEMAKLNLVTQEKNMQMLPRPELV